MHELQLITRSGPAILMAPTLKQLHRMFRRFLSSDSLALVDEPDETDIPIYIHNSLVNDRKLLRDKR